MKPCAIEWITIPAPNLEAGIVFYRDVFGFTLEKFNERFWVFRAGNISGGLDLDLSVNGAGIGFSVTVPDMQGAMERITAFGGTIVKDPCELAPGAGFSAKFTDPSGNLLELYAERMIPES